MAVMIKDVSITPSEVIVGQTITITITALDVTWEVIKEEFTDWNEIAELSNWKSVMNYH